MLLPEKWDLLDDDIKSDALVVAFDLGQNTVVGLRGYGDAIFPDIPEDLSLLGPEYILARVHVDDHPALLDALEKSARLAPGESNSHTLRVLVDKDHEVFNFRTTPLLTDRLGHVYVVRTIIFRN